MKRFDTITAIREAGHEDLAQFMASFTGDDDLVNSVGGPLCICEDAKDMVALEGYREDGTLTRAIDHKVATDAYYIHGKWFVWTLITNSLGGTTYVFPPELNDLLA